MLASIFRELERDKQIFRLLHGMSRAERAITRQWYGLMADEMSGET